MTPEREVKCATVSGGMSTLASSTNNAAASKLPCWYKSVAINRFSSVGSYGRAGGAQIEKMGMKERRRSKMLKKGRYVSKDDENKNNKE